MKKKNETIDWLSPDDIETARFTVAKAIEGQNMQIIAVAPLANNETSIILTTYKKDTTHNYMHYILNEKETDMLIEALQENKRRWKTGKVVSNG